LEIRTDNGPGRVLTTMQMDPSQGC